MKRRRFLRWAGGAAAGAMALGGYATVVEPGLRLRRQHWTARPPAWPRELRLRIAVLADLHAAAPLTPEARIERVVEATNALSADLIVLLGDYVATHRFVTRRVPIDWTARALAALRAPLGVYAVLGNHDWWDDLDAQGRAEGPTRSHDAFAAASIPLLENDAVMLEQNGRPFRLAGLGDQLAFRPDLVRGMGGVPKRRRAARLQTRGVDDLPGTLAQGDPRAPTILLAHEPDIFPDVPPSVALTISGHTHGGQVRLAGWAPFTSSIYGDRYVYGLVEEQDRALVVSAGIGCSILPVRFGAPPEITLIDVA